MTDNKKFDSHVPGRKPYDSIYRPPILKGVRNEDVWDFAIKHEQPIQHFYKDKEGNVTIGVGKIVPNEKKAQELVFDVMKNESIPVRRATKKEIESAFEKIEQAPKGLTWDKYDPFKYPQFDKLHMPDDIMHREMDDDLRRSAQELRQKIPNFDAIEPEAQQALLDMQFNIGDHKFRSQYWDPKNRQYKKAWNDLYAAIDKKNWEKAAKESRREHVNEERNKAVEDLFSKAHDRQKRKALR